MRVRVHSGFSKNAKERHTLRTRGRVLGAEWKKWIAILTQNCTDLWKILRDIHTQLSPFKVDLLAVTLTLPLPFPFPCPVSSSSSSRKPPAAPSHSSYEPRAGRSEYNFLYCVNVRTYVWIRKMFILRSAAVVGSFCVSFNTPLVWTMFVPEICQTSRS